MAEVQVAFEVPVAETAVAASAVGTAAEPVADMGAAAAAGIAAEVQAVCIVAAVQAADTAAQADCTAAEEEYNGAAAVQEPDTAAVH